MRSEAVLADRSEPWYQMTLIVSAASELSARAIVDARRLCETHLGGRYHLSVVDLREVPAAVFADQVLAAPTLIKNRPLPLQRFVGDLRRDGEVLLALGLPALATGGGGQQKPSRSQTPLPG